MPPRPELLGLLRDAKLSPDDVAPRLILADWLEEHGEPERAEFVRLQCLGTTDEEKRRASELAKAHESRWLGPVEGATYSRTWKRGLLGASALMSSILFPPASDPASLEAFEWLERMHLRDIVSDLLDTLVASPRLQVLNALTLEFIRHDPGRRRPGEQVFGMPWAALGRLPTLPHLRELTLRALPLDAAGLEALFAAGLNRLHDLTLELLRVTEEHQEVIPRLPTLPRLRSLSLRAWNAGALTAWFHWPGLAQVDRLQLQFAERDLGTVQGLLASPFRESLTHLCLNANLAYQDQTGATETFEGECEPFREVRSLEIHGFRIGFLLSLLRRFPRLEELDLSQSRISRGDLGSVLELLPTETLRCLKLSGLYLRDDALPLLTGSPALDRVECLEILHTGHFSSEPWQAVRDHFGSRLSFRGST